MQSKISAGALTDFDSKPTISTHCIHIKQQYFHQDDSFLQRNVKISNLDLDLCMLPELDCC